MPELPVLVAGGGIGGLAAALTLARKGRAVRVLEQGAEFKEIGAGIQLGPNVFRMFERLGLTDAIERVAFHPHNLVMMDAVSGEEVIRLPVGGAAFRERFAYPYGVIHRGDLHTVMLEACRAEPNITLSVNAKGLRYVAQLLRHEGREFHAADLAAAADIEAPAVREPDGEVSLGLGDAGEMLDPLAREEYRQRLEDLRAELDEATRWGDSGRASKLGEEIEFLTQELSAAFGLGGRARKAGDVADRARKAVTSRIRETIARITKEHPVLGRHLENAIRTGVFCSYTPDRSPLWEV